ncbi:MAG: hypothetical protein LBT25_08500 [Candidatus Symbiothrix sp.]|jgi:hypothetical protein|nr:hypothetical protein [Candidatus Symbiothrix sp.]
MSNYNSFYSKEANELLNKKTPYIIRFIYLFLFILIYLFILIGYYINVPIEMNTTVINYNIESNEIMIASKQKYIDKNMTPKYIFINENEIKKYEISSFCYMKDTNGFYNLVLHVSSIENNSIKANMNIIVFNQKPFIMLCLDYLLMGTSKNSSTH